MHISRQERMESFDQKHYVRPHLAYSKMKLAEESGKTVWLYGATSYGKTSFINSYFGNRHITYFSANQLQEADLITSEELRGTIVIDDLQTLLCPDICQDIWKAIEKLVMKEDAWLILISRGKIPKWLHGTFIKHLFTVIEEKDLEEGVLAEIIEELMADPERVRNMEAASKQLGTISAADTICSMIGIE